MLATAEAGPSPLHLPSSLHHSWGQFPETGSGPPNQLGTVSGPSGAGKSRGPTGRKLGVQPPIQCDGFLCSVVFLTPGGGRSPWGNQGSYRCLPGSCSSVCCGSSEAGGAEEWPGPTQGPASGAHGAWAPMSLVCALQSWGPPRKGLAGGESQKGSESGNKVQGARLGAGCGEGRGEGRGPADTKLHGSMRLRRGEGRGRLMRPRGGERGVPGVPGAERDIPGGGETVPPMRVQEGHRVRQPPPPRCHLAHCAAWETEAQRCHHLSPAAQ